MILSVLIGSKFQLHFMTEYLKKNSVVIDDWLTVFPICNIRGFGYRIYEINLYCRSASIALLIVKLIL